MEKYKIKNLGTIISGGTPSTSNENYWDGNIIWITPKDLSKNKCKYIYTGERNISKDGLEHSSAKLLPKNAVLLSSRAPIGYLALAGCELTTNQGFKSIVCNESIILSEYLYYLLSTKIDDLISISSGSTFLELSKSAFENLELNIHNINEQQHIVDTIGSIDNKIEHNEKLISKIEEFLLLKFNKLEKTVGVVFSDVFRCFNGGTFKSLDYVDLSQYKLITIKNIDNTGFNTSNATYIPKMNKYEKYKLSIGDILLTMTGAYLGRLGIVDEDNCYLNQRVLKISGMSKSFLYCFLKYNQNEIFSLGKGSAQPNLSITDLNIFPVNYSHNTIKSFCFNDKYIDYIINLKQEIKKLKILKQNYLHKFFG